MLVFDVVLLSLAISLEPIPLTAFILVLASERGTLKGLGFVLAWLLSFVVVIAATMAATGGQPPKPSSAPSIGLLVAKIVLGLGLIALGLRRHQTRNRPRKAPTWMSRLDRLSVLSAAGLAILVQPWGLIAMGAAVIAGASLSQGATWLVFVLFCLLGTGSLLAMELFAAFSPERARERLDQLRQWIAGHQEQVIVVLALGVGVWFVAKSLFQLVTTG